MYELNYTENDILDLKEDFLMNNEYSLYGFFENDPERAFFLGCYFKEWFDLLESNEKKFLYTSQARRVNEYLEDYIDQYQYWTDVYNKDKELNDNVELVSFSEYILNNMIFQPEDEEELSCYLAFFLGTVTSKFLNNKKENKEENKDGSN